MKIGEMKCENFINKENKNNHKCYNCPLRKLDFYGCSNNKIFFETFEKYKEKYSPSYREQILDKLNEEVKQTGKY